MRIRQVIMSLAAWTVGAATAVTVGLVALPAIGAGLADGPIQPLAPHAQSQPEQVGAEATTAGTAGGASSASTPAAGAQVDRTVPSRGGAVVARCRVGGAYLVGWSPAPGFQADDIQRGPAATATVTFAGRDADIRVTVSCVSGVIQPTIQEESPEVDHAE